MKNILITGANGFLGSHILHYLVKNTNYKPFILTRKNANLNRIETLLHQTQIFDVAHIDRLFEEHKIDAILHTATAYGHDENALTVLQANVHFPILLLQKALQNGTQKFINTDTFTSKINNYPYLPFYHIAKRNFKEWATEMVKNQNIELTTAYLGHLYGTFDGENKFLPSIIMQLLQKVPQIDLTAGEQKRDFIFAEDVAQIYFKILESPTAIENIEIGTGLASSIKEVVLKCQQLTQNSNTQLNFGKLPYRHNEIMNAVSDISTLKQLNFAPQFDIQKGLQATVAYFKEKTNNSL